MELTEKLLWLKTMQELYEDYANNKITEDVVDISETYGIFSTTLQGTSVTENGSSIPNFNIRKDEIESLEDLAVLLHTYKNIDEYYGSIIILDKIPYNPLSLVFMSKIQSGALEISANTAVYSYVATGISINIDKNVYSSTYELLSNLKVESLLVEKEQDNCTVYARFLPHDVSSYEDIGLHISDIVVERKNKESIINCGAALEEDFIIGSEVTTNNNKVTDILTHSKWCIELSIIDKGVKIPSYGIFIHDSSKVLPYTYATLHPNISSNGSNYCTGSLGKRTLKGVSELSYGNLNSPLNRDVWTSTSFSRAKAFIDYYMELFLSIEV